MSTRPRSSDEDGKATAVCSAASSEEAKRGATSRAEACVKPLLSVPSALTACAAAAASSSS
eukprot:CAMPEP_0185560014 /NCGR_PEP_ID=MMETSP1381-20130426/55892_1 /TAXON_ID=298111 /ORGANISM="Pavlova sp., Strain CCMP459" /LENGTH=60 /DNA_ID=CAMNT_0028173681 /DNA_START=33 /DNA_END=212 /DNA_ORIENTATION=-